MQTRLVGVALMMAAGLVGAQVPRSLIIEARIQIEEGPAEPIADLRDFAVGNGRVYALDFKRRMIHLYGRDGGFQKSVSRLGSGPGELREANGLLVAPDSTLWVNDYGNSRISVFSGDGSYLRQHSLTANMHLYSWEGAFDDQKRLYTAVSNGSRASGGASFQRRRLDGRIIDTILRKPALRPAPRATVYTIKFKNGGTMGSYPFRDLVPTAFDPAGHWWGVADPTEYRIAKETLEGAEVLVARRGVRAEPISGARRDSARKSLEKQIAGAESHDVDFARIPSSYAFVQQLVVGPRGQLWVRRVVPDDAFAVFDVFDAQGVYQWSARLNERLSKYGRLLVEGNALWAVALDDDDVPTIIRARLQPAR